MICENLNGPLEPQDIATNDPGAQYNIEKSQKFPVHIPTFLQRNEGDPAIKVSSLPPLSPELTHTSTTELLLEVEGLSTALHSIGTSARG